MSAFIDTLKTISSNKDLAVDSDKKRDQAAIDFIKKTMRAIIDCMKETFDKKLEKKVENLCDDMYSKMEKYFKDNKKISKLVNEFEKTVSKCLKDKKKNAKCCVCKDCLSSQRNPLSCGCLVHVSCVVKTGSSCCPVCKVKVKLSATNAKKCEQANKSKSKKQKEEKLNKEIDAHMAKLQELGYFTCSDSDCSCNDFDSSDSDSGSSDCSSDCSSDDSSDGSSDASDTSDESSSSDEDVKIDYEKMYKTMYGKLQLMDKQNPKIKQTVQSTKNIYNKMTKRQQQKYKDEFELLDTLFE
jgi:hypothetical protein